MSNCSEYIRDAFFGAAESSCTCTRATATVLFSKEIPDIIDRVVGMCYGQSRIIEVWKGDNTMFPRRKYPVIHEVAAFDEDTCYIIAGGGVAAGKKVFAALKAMNCVAVWVDDPPDYPPERKS